MKNSILLGFILLFGAFSLNAQNVVVPNEQKPLIVKIAASWCPPCGGWGWSFFDDIYDDNKEDAIFLSVHHSGEHTNSAASEITSNFSVFGQPRFILDGTDQNVSSSNVSMKRTEIEDKVANELNSAPTIQAGIDATYSDNVLNVDWSVKTFDNLSGEYYVSFYLVEKVHVGYQASIGNDAQHKALLRGELSGSTFGELLFNGTATTGDVFNGDIQASLEDYNPENLEIVSVIWNKVGNTYEVANTNVDDNVEEQITSSIEITSGINPDINVYPTIVDKSFTVGMFLAKELADAQLYLSDFNGRVAQYLFKGLLPEGEIKMTFERNAGITNGIYILNIVTDQKIQTKKIIFE